MRHCQHKRKPSNRAVSKKDQLRLRDKKTECPSKFTLKVHNSESSTNKKHKTHPCEVNLLWDHNHTTESAKALSFRPLSVETVQTMHSYFELGHSPASAFHLHNLNLAVQYESKNGELEKARADRSLNPLYTDVYYLYRKWRVKNHGEPNGEQMFNKMEQLVKSYNANYGSDGGGAFLQKYQKKGPEDMKKMAFDNPDTPLILAICTPLMARAHTLLQQSSELVFCDSTASLDRYNCPTFIMSTSSSAGGIPLGVVITSGEAETTLTEAFSYLKTVMPQKSFYGRGGKGPSMFVTDDCDAEKNALRSTWPDSNQLLCVFHYLQSWWKWLWDNRHGIADYDRQPVMELIRKLVYTTNEVELEQCYNQLISPTSTTVSFTQKYPQLMARLKGFWKRRSEWALSYRVAHLTRGNNTNNYAEAGIRVLKEIVFGRVKAFNLVQMFDFITVTMDTYYTNRLLDIAHSRFRPGLNLRYRELSNATSNIVEMKQVRDSIYIVHEDIPNIGMTDYVVDMELGTCSCTVGSTGAACRHQAALAKKYEVKTINLPPLHDKETRQTLAIIAQGKQNVQDIAFYADLLDKPSTKLLHTITDEYKPKHDLNTQSNDTHLPPTDQEDFCNDVVHYKHLLDDVVDDLVRRMEIGDHNIVSGVSHFIKTYKRLQSSHSPDSAISYALHNFGKSDRKLYM